MARTVRVAILQTEFQPSAIDTFSCIEEPTLLEQGETGITSLRLHNPLHSENLVSLKQSIAKSHEDFIHGRLTALSQFLLPHHIDLLVVPEYFIPPTLLQTLSSLSGYTIIASSHTVTRTSVAALSSLGIQVTYDDLHRNICPVRLLDGGWMRIDKLSRSEFESSNKPGEQWQVIPIITKQDETVTLAVLLCIDFLNDFDPNIESLVNHELWKSVDIGVIPSFSNVTEDFQRKAMFLAKRIGKPILFSNVSRYGGTRIVCNFPGTGLHHGMDGTSPLGKDTEALIIADLILDEGQYRFRPTALPIPPSSRILGTYPLLSRNRYTTLFAFIDGLKDTSEGDLEEYFSCHSEELKTESQQNPVNQIHQENLHFALDNIGKYSKDDLLNLLSIVEVPEQSFSSMSFELCNRAKAALIDIGRDLIGDSAALMAVTEAISTYRNHLDALSSANSQEFSSSIPLSAMPVASPSVLLRNPTQGHKASFVLVHNAARLHSQSLIKQIQLLSAIRRMSDSPLTLDLRYQAVSTTDFKGIVILLIGTVQAESKESALYLADQFRRDFSNLANVTLAGAYTLRLLEVDEANLPQTLNPHLYNSIIEMHKSVSADSVAAKRIPLISGNSSFARIVDLLIRYPGSLSFSTLLNPIFLSAEEKLLFPTQDGVKPSMGGSTIASMFFLGTEKYPSSRLHDVTILEGLLEQESQLLPSLQIRSFLYAEQPIPLLLQHAIANELFGSCPYALKEYERGTSEFAAIQNGLQSGAMYECPYPSGQNLPSNRLPHLMNVYEASRMFRLPLERHTGSVRKLTEILPAPIAALPTEGIVIGQGWNSGAERPVIVRLSKVERTKHTYVLGKTGTGKSTLLSNMFIQDIELGNGACLLDPHGDIVDSVLERIPRHRQDDVILFDPSSLDRPIGLNLLEHDPSNEFQKDFVVQEVISIMYKMFYYQHVGPVFEHSVRNFVLAVMHLLGSDGTLVEVAELLVDLELLRRAINSVSDPRIKHYLEQYLDLSKKDREMLMWVVSKFGRFTSDNMMRNILGQSRSSLNIGEVFKGKKILLVKLPSAAIGEFNSALLGMILISKVKWAAMNRVTTEERLNEYFLYVDEFQYFATTGFETLLAEARKYGLGLVMAHQHIDQLSAFQISTGGVSGLAQSIFGNVGNMIIFRLGAANANLLTAELGPPVEEFSLENLENYHATVKCLIDGVVYPPFTIRTFQLPTTAVPEVSIGVRDRSNEIYGRPRELVIEEMAERLARISSPDNSSDGSQ